jgi:A/G-specific adenine glycosylase
VLYSSDKEGVIHRNSFMTTKRDSDIVFIRDVLDFYAIAGRHSLVWRKQITAYKILVSEIMLQQTQVSRVLPKFNEWLKKYPTLKDLSYANLQDILLLWQGLGYQRRAKALYLIAKSNKKIPKKFEDLILLPGIGTYTASAISAFAYNQFSHPVLETNIRTALLDFFHPHSEVVDDCALYKDLKRLEQNPLIVTIGARVWYYALMDYGANLKNEHVSHNTKSAHYARQTKYKGSLRELRAKVLFAITRQEVIPKDERVEEVLRALLKEGFIDNKQGAFRICS